MVQDARTGDYKAQEERRDGGHVRGTYSVAEPNGDLRVVSYSADGDSGFRAEVRVEPAGAITSEEGRTFATFFQDPSALFRGPTIYSNRPPIDRPVNFDRQVPFNRPTTVLNDRPNERPGNINERPSIFNERPGIFNDRPNIYTERPFNTRPHINPERPYNDRPNVYTDRPIVAANVYSDRPTIYTERPSFVQQADDMSQFAMYPVFDRTRVPETSGITPASTYQLFNKPLIADTSMSFSKPLESGSVFTGFRPHLPETPAIPITPPSPFENQGDIITVPAKSSFNFAPKFQMMRRPPVATPKPTPVTPIRYSTPQQPFQIMRYSPSVYAPQRQNYWQASMPYVGDFNGYGGNIQNMQTPYMLVRTYLVPMPPGQTPSNLVPMQMQTMTQSITPTIAAKTTPVKTTSEPFQSETNSPALAVTTVQDTP